MQRVAVAAGNTCVIGAGYVALECAGFLTGLHQGKVTVLVRSMPLRTFDQDVVKYIRDYMEHQGTRIVEGVTPHSIEKLPSGKFLVAYGDTSEEFDTVLQVSAPHCIISSKLHTSHLRLA